MKDKSTTKINGPMQTPYKDIPKNSSPKALYKGKPSKRRGGMRK